MKVVLDLDDFSILRSRMDLLTKLHDHFPGFKVSLFTIPFDYEYERTDVRIMRDEANALIQQNLDWMQFIPHGLAHIPREFENCDRETMEDYVNNIEEEFKKIGLPMTKGFKAPYWLWNQEVVDVLNEHGWWGAIDKNQPEMIKPKRYYQYAHSIDEPFWEAKTRHNVGKNDISTQDDEVLLLHGHMTPPSTNNLNDCFLNLLKLPLDTQWHFATDFIT